MPREFRPDLVIEFAERLVATALTEVITAVRALLADETVSMERPNGRPLADVIPPR